MKLRQAPETPAPESVAPQAERVSVELSVFDTHALRALPRSEASECRSRSEALTLPRSEAC